MNWSSSQLTDCLVHSVGILSTAEAEFSSRLIRPALFGKSLGLLFTVD